MRTFCNAPRLTFVFKNEAQLVMPLFLFLCLLAFPITGFAQDRTFGNGTLSEFLSIYDVDASGGLSAEELQALRADRKDRRSRLKNRWDTDGNGKISNAEREAAKTAIRRQIEIRRGLRFDEVDDNSDGFLSLAEFNNIAAVGAVDEARPGVSDELYQNLDLNDDGKVSKREFLRKIDSIPVAVDPANIPKRHPRTNNVAPAPNPAPAPVVR